MSVQGYYSSYETSMVPQPLRYGPLYTKPNVNSSRTNPNAIITTRQELPPKPRPQEQVRPDLPIPVPTDKPAGYYLVIQRSRSIINNQIESHIVRPLPERKGRPKFSFGCLPNKKPRAIPRYEPPIAIPIHDAIKPPAAQQPLRTNFGYYPIYERPPGFGESMIQQSTPTLNSKIEVPPPPVPRRNPRGRYPDYELS